jgi:hypothetical protein
MKKTTETVSNLEVLDRLLEASMNQDNILCEAEETALSAVLEDYRELKRGLSIALAYIGEDIYHYEDIGDEDALESCQSAYNKLREIYDKATA